MEILKDRNSFDSAYEVQDYPYGFRLRCKMRYWIEWKDGKGARVWSCTSNPKREGLVWNKPKAGVYAKYGQVLVIVEDGHVHAVSCNEYADTQELLDYRNSYGAGLPMEAQERLQSLIEHKIRYEEKRARGLSTPVAIAEMRMEDILRREAASGKID